MYQMQRMVRLKLVLLFRGKVHFCLCLRSEPPVHKCQKLCSSTRGSVQHPGVIRKMHALFICAYGTHKLMRWTQQSQQNIDRQHHLINYNLQTSIAVSIREMIDFWRVDIVGHAENPTFLSYKPRSPWSTILYCSRIRQEIWRITTCEGERRRQYKWYQKCLVGQFKMSQVRSKSTHHIPN